MIDGGSTDRDTREVLDELAARPHVCVIRSPTNSGPSAARNRGIAQAKGRFVLPVDADNRLAQGAIHSLVRQLQSAGERVGFIYPNLQYFGTREDYYQPPSYNLALLRHCVRRRYLGRLAVEGRRTSSGGLLHSR